MNEMKSKKELGECYKKLSGMNVTEHTDKKNGLTYLSWAKAWDLLCREHPDATYEVVKNENNLPYFASELGIMVYTKMTIDGITREMWLSVMDSSNRALRTTPYKIVKKGKDNRPYEIEVAAATMNDINKAVMRCLTKNIAMFGLGIHVYEGEDITIEEQMVDAEEALNKAVTKASEAKDAVSLLGVWASNAAYQKNKDFVSALYDRLQGLIDGANTREEVAAIYRTSTWAQASPRLTNMCSDRVRELSAA